MTAKQFAFWSGDLPSSVMQEKGWTFVEYADEGYVAAVAALRGTEIHFAINPAYRGRLMFRNRIREFLRPLFEDKGFLTTRIQKNDDLLKNARFVARLGFKHTQDDANVAHFMLSELPYER